MLSNFITYIQRQDLFRLSRDKILLAVSGGVDSVALVRLCKKAGIKFGIAHCNFQLRDAESNGDAAFVEALAKEVDVPYHSISFDTNRIAKETKKSIQIAARDLRYSWFEELRLSHDYQYIAVAHHHNDSIETLFINLIMGCGIRGLHGILPKNGYIVRPLLFATRKEVESYISSNNFAHREDSSNASTQYTRNAIRHLVVPELQKITPILEETFHANFQRFRETELMYNYATEQLKKEWTQQRGENLWIDIEGLVQSPAPLSFLYELLSPYNFKNSKIQYIFKDRQEVSGTMYSSKTHHVLRDRTHWIVSPIQDTKEEIHYIQQLEGKKGILNAAGLDFNWDILDNIPSLENDNNTGYFDVEKLEFPLRLRHWKDGDILHPLGMNGKKKKLSKFFKDIKMNRFEKDATWLLCNANNQIVWVVGFRADERFNVDNSTQSVLRLTF
jgi:tRNA(Ile)-lysidine synthase